MIKHTIDYLKEAVCSASPNHGLTLIEIQRWEDDGGAIPACPPPRRRRCERHDHEEPHELAVEQHCHGDAGSPSEATPSRYAFLSPGLRTRPYFMARHDAITGGYTIACSGAVDALLEPDHPNKGVSRVADY